MFMKKYFILTLLALLAYFLVGCINGINGNVNDINNSKNNSKVENVFNKTLLKTTEENEYKILIYLKGENLSIYVSTEKPTLGYSLKIDNYNISDNSIILHLTIKKPGQSCFVGQAITEIKDSINIKMPKPISESEFNNLEIIINDNTYVYEC
ncbi:MAG: protease complex subunit PrcB family protein [Candidatus Anstonellales archaeon]